MNADFRAKFHRAELTTLLRFSLVGGASTLVFTAVSWLLIWLQLMPTALITVTAMASGIAASYAGHYYYTYRKVGGQHLFFGPRFLTVTATLVTASVALTYAAVEIFHFSAYLVSASIAVLYPLASLALHHFWTFQGEAASK